MKAEKKIILIFSLAAASVLLASGFVLAQKPLEVGYPVIEGAKPETTSITLPEYVKYIFNLSLGLAGLIVFSVLVYAGFRYMTSVGDPGRRRDAKERIIAAFLGLAILLLSYLILTTINPQLVVLSMPGRTIFSPVSIIGNPPPDPKTLYYTEIPVGPLIEQLFLKTRLLRISTTSEFLMYRAEKVKDLSNELKALTDSCSCAYVDIGTCYEGSCGGNTSCTNNCYCYGEPRENFDPCPSRSAIDAKREELKIAINEDEIGLKYRQKEFEKELTDFRDLYDKLLSAEQLIKDCSGNPGGTGSLRDLFGYKEFLVYSEKLLEDKIIERVEGGYPLGHFASSTYDSVIFYCSDLKEAAVQIQPEEIPLVVEEVPLKEIFCEEEIPIGETIDNAEELAKRMLAEMENIDYNALREISNSEILSDLPEDCRGSNCNSNMNTSNECCEWVECNCRQEYAGEECVEECSEITSECTKSCTVFYEEVCDECCVYEACTWCRCTCTGGPCPADIGTLVSAINNNYSEILRSREILIDLINERVEDKLKISNIFKVLRLAQSKLDPCFNTRERYGALELAETTDWEYLYSCSNALQFLELQAPIFHEGGDEITECYGPSGANPDFMDNFFCCHYEISF